ncbi:hypothetical protein J9303_12420 [Bacillaceae bacterium Marseille-Q3522]|nr:hypothetical protein [Bacillaceae bacterium Marseille-Q3522]
MKKMLIMLWVKLSNPVKNEEGAQSLEWLGLAALLIFVLGILSQVLKGSETSIQNIISNILTQIQNLVGTPE